MLGNMPLKGLMGERKVVVYRVEIAGRNVFTALSYRVILAPVFVSLDSPQHFDHRVNIFEGVIDAETDANHAGFSGFVSVHKLSPPLRLSFFSEF
jgi:hypothetical protein